MGKTIHILCEGPTEEKFIKNILTPYYSPINIFLIPIIIKTKKLKEGRKYKGGITSYRKVKNDLLLLLADSSADIVTTMIDYYALPDDFPEYSKKPKGSPYERVEFLENEFHNDISNKKFIPYLQLHEFEALVFANYSGLTNVFTEQRDEMEEVKSIVKAFKSPEEINEGRETAPSKRLKKIFGNYRKVLHSQLVLQNANIDMIRKSCTHFNSWLLKLENFNE